MSRAGRRLCFPFGYLRAIVKKKLVWCPQRIFKGSRNDLFLKVDGNEFTLCVGIRFISGHGYSLGMDSIHMSISIIHCPCSSSILSAKNDFFYRFNEKLSRSREAAIGFSDWL